MRRVLRVLCVLFLISVCWTVAGGAGERTARESQGKLKIIATVFGGEDDNLVVLRPSDTPSRSLRFLRQDPQALPPDGWFPPEVRISRDGKVRVINGMAALMVSSGIRIWGPADTEWRELSWSCMDENLSMTATDVYFHACGGADPGLMRVPIDGSWTDVAPVYAGCYRVGWAQSSPAGDRFAEIQSDYVDGVSYYRLNFIDTMGNVASLPWITGGIWDVRWDPAGEEVMYTGAQWDYESGVLLYRVRGDAVELLEEDIDGYTYLPDGGYAFARGICPAIPDYESKKCFPYTELVLVREEARRTYFVKGQINHMDAYLEQ